MRRNEPTLSEFKIHLNARKTPIHRTGFTQLQPHIFAVVSSFT